jgi:hypothetical protein
VNNLATTRRARAARAPADQQPEHRRGGNQVNPRRLDPANINDVLTCDQDHNYNAEQKAFDGGAMDKFVTTVGTATGKSGTGPGRATAGDVMNYYDGNTVTGLWNYAQQFAMSDNSFGTTFGPSAPGAINLASGDTGGVGKMINGAATDGDTVPTARRLLADRGRPAVLRRLLDARRRLAHRQNIGDELNAAGLSWGWFQGGFRPTTTFATATAGAQPTSTFTPDQFKGKFAVAPASDQGLCNAVHPVGARSAAPAAPAAATTATRTTTSPTTSRSSTTRPPPTRTTCRRRWRRWRRSAPTRSTRRRRAAVRHREPPVRHERLRLARRRDQPRLPLTGPAPAGGELPQGARLPGRPRRLLRPARRAAVRHRPRSTRSSTRRTGRAPRS